MILPEHVNPTREIAVAPYNFVPLPEAVLTSGPLPDHSRYHADRFTGTVRCTLKTETPLYTRAALEQSEVGSLQAKDKSDFFYIDSATKQPVIPGSGLRGMLRTLIEIAGFGKIDQVAATPLVYRSVGDTTRHGERYRERLMQFDGNGYNAKGKSCKLYTPLVQAGYMERVGSEWHIQPAQKIGGTSFARINIDALERIRPKLATIPGCKNAVKIYVQPSAYDYQEVRGGFLRIKYAKVLRASDTTGAGLIEATVGRSGAMASKRSEAVIFARNPQASSIPISDELIYLYKEQISAEQEQLLGKNGVLNHGQPVFYLIENGELKFFSHTMMMRLPYTQTALDFVPPGLRDPSTIDLADALFGFIRGSDEESRAGRVYVGNAYLVAGQTDLWLQADKPIVPRILGGPKPTTFQHYLVQQTPDPEQVGRTKDGQPKYQKQLADYESNTPEQAVIRGHKLYWHKGTVSLNEIQEPAEVLATLKPDDKQHTRIHPIKPGVTFEFAIRFENVSSIELGALLWILTLPGENGKQYRHKVGMGKPYGMGSVLISSSLWLSDRTTRYKTLFDAEGWHEATAQADATQVTSVISKFEQYVLSKLTNFEKGTARDLSQVFRVRTLLKMLEWMGPNKEQTRYLEIERRDESLKRGKVNEYKNRPVLPAPVKDPLRGQATNPTRTPPRTAPTPKARPTTSTTEATASTASSELAQGILARLQGHSTPAESDAATENVPTISNPKTKDDLKPGMMLEGTVIRVEPNRVVVNIGVNSDASLSADQVAPTIRPGDQAALIQRFFVGKVIRIWYLRTNERGTIQLTMKERKS